MEFLEQVHLFATKWIEKFRDQKISYIELVDLTITWPMIVRHWDSRWIAAMPFQKNMAMQQPS